MILSILLTIATPYTTIISVYTCICTYVYVTAAEMKGAAEYVYSRLLKMIGLFCKRALQKKRYPAKETYNFKEPTNTTSDLAD